tara:strand:+ start:2619 stop:3560 length:942 start_codon:yes stop_codon:yes gene_type:complete
MNLQKNFLVIIIVAIGIYAIFLFISDYNIITEKIIFFQIEYLFPILLLVSISWIPLIIRWNILLKQNEINIPFKKSTMIWLSGSALGVTPGQIGELLKCQILKNLFNIPRSKTAPIVFVEKFYDLIGAVIASTLGIIVLGIDYSLIAVSICILGTLIFLISYRKAFDYFLTKISKTKFFTKYSDNLSDSHRIIRHSTNQKIAFISILLSLIYWLIISVAVYLTLLAFNIDTIGIIETIAIYTASVLVGVITFVPGGIGITEGSLTGLFVLQGVDLSLALVISVIIRIFTLWYSVSIGFICLKISGGLTTKHDS